MLKVSATIASVDYESTLTALFPLLSDKLSHINSDHVGVQAFRQLGDAALPVAAGVLRRLPNETKSELMVSAVNAYSSLLTVKLNELLKSKVGNGITIGGISAAQYGNTIQLSVYQVRADYHTLINNGAVEPMLTRHFGRIANWIVSFARMLFSPDEVEARILPIAMKAQNKQRILSALNRILNTHGIGLVLSGIQIEKSNAAVTLSSDREPGFVLSERQKQALLSAVTVYLKDTVSV